MLIQRCSSGRNSLLTDVRKERKRENVRIYIYSNGRRCAQRWTSRWYSMRRACLRSCTSLVTELMRSGRRNGSARQMLTIETLELNVCALVMWSSCKRWNQNEAKKNGPETLTMPASKQRSRSPITEEILDSRSTFADETLTGMCG